MLLLPTGTEATVGKLINSGEINVIVKGEELEITSFREEFALLQIVMSH